MNFEALFAPGRIGPLEISNRILESPQGTATSNADGTVSARTVNHHLVTDRRTTGLRVHETGSAKTPGRVCAGSR